MFVTILHYSTYKVMHILLKSVILLMYISVKITDVCPNH